MNRISGNVNLLALKHVKMEVEGENGKVMGIFIPIEINQLEDRNQDKTPKLNIKFDIVPTPDKDQDGFVSQKGLKKWSELTDEEKEQDKLLPILGNVKEWDGTPDGTNNAVSDETFKPGNKLPF